MKRLLLILLINSLGYVHSQKYKICAYPYQQKFCTELGRGSSEVECLNVQDSVDCAWKLQQDEAHFGSFYPEQAVLVSKFLNNVVSVVGEIRDAGAYDKNHAYRTVVLVKSDYTGGLNGFKGKKYCHFGFDDEPSMTLRAKQEFENAIVQVSSECTENKTIVEKEVAEYSSLFSQACRPGQWVADEVFDQKLKSSYRNLCELCDNPSACAYNEDINPSKNALKCLTEKGDVAYTTAQAVEEFFVGDLESKKGDYKLLCRNGETQEITSEISNNCTWRNQPWTLIMSKKEKSADIAGKLNQWIESNYIISKQSLDRRGGAHDWSKALRQILSSEQDTRKYYLTEPTTPEQYFINKKQEFTPTPENNKCMLKWCAVGDDELDKCIWLTEAMDLQGIKPKLKCVKQDNIYGCLKGIKENTVDAVAIDSHYGFLARKYSAARNLMNFEESSDDISKIFTVIRPQAEIKSFEDLKGKKACFPEYRGIGWLAFIQYAREKKLIPDTCDYGKSTGDFFSAVCAPGVKDTHHARTSGADVNILCSLCKNKDTEQTGFCDASEQNAYYNDTGALACLKDGAGDVAFVELSDLAGGDNFSYANLLCKDGRIIDNIKVELNEQCALIATVNSEIISKGNNKGNQDFQDALLRIDRLFGKSSTEDETMNVFATFKGHNDLLFKNNVLGISKKGDGNVYSNNYNKIFEAVEICTKNAAATLVGSAVLILLTYILNFYN